MRSKKMFVLAVAAIVLAASPILAVYEVVDLGTLGGDSSVAYSINNSGQIVGQATDADGHNRATLFDPTGSGNNIDLGGLAGDSEARSINDKGQIVGQAWFPPGYLRAARWDPADGSYGPAIDLDPLPDSQSSRAYGMNNSAQIVGQSYFIAGDYWRATLWDPVDGGYNIVDLGTLGGDSSLARSINDSAQVVGEAETGSGLVEATLFDATGAGSNVNLSAWKAFSVNNNGLIVGRRHGYFAIVLDPTGSGNHIELALDAGGSSDALSINNTDQIVGYFIAPSWDYRAMLFDPTGGRNNIDLNELIDPALGWTLSTAHCISDNGWIVGEGINPDGESHAFLLVPEPATVLLLGMGAVMLRRKR